MPIAAAVPALIGAAASVGGSMLSSKSAAKSQKNATEANLAASRETNELNKQMFDESRGSTGHAFLPTYTGDAEKRTFEDLYNIYQTGLSPVQRQAQAQAAVDAMMPAVQGGNRFLADAYSGKNLEQSRSYYQPLWDARLATAEAQAEAMRQAYVRTANQQRALAQRQGFYGGSSVRDAELQRAMLASMQNAALARGSALMQNYGEGAQLGIADLANQQALLNAPISRAQALTNLSSLPSEAAYSGYDQLANRLGLFNIGKGQFTYQNQPLVQPEIGSGQVVGSALGALGQLGQQYAMNKLYQDQYQNWYQNTYNQPVGGWTGNTSTFQGNLYPASPTAIQDAKIAQANAGF